MKKKIVQLLRGKVPMKHKAIKTPKPHKYNENNNKNHSF